ncbi:hypothetical protein Rleg4DRAFT_2285 [Rhizobium leguminosarum bv. trifolii WSM2297]|uniref:Uncharacterized protein n=1 Tax=Rhizobium leguminosarum bv. trifolii WSM2297 TaxID=754762 RepID=J0CM53_RHILT|nr:hypothetical protein [Rhizobium leguminosarum]EJC80650.1 hypothetical protein Rleg4DRAFT_2285 [Rhizobium leguminosarum bv. trifolii WSM2297]
MNFYTVTSLNGSSTTSAHHIEDAVNGFARKYLGAAGAVAWASKSANRDPAKFDGSTKVLLLEGESNFSEDPQASKMPSDPSKARSIWIFEPRRRYDQILSSLNEVRDGQLETALREIAVLAPMIKDLCLAAVVRQINEVLPAHLRCSISF